MYTCGRYRDFIVYKAFFVVLLNVTHFVSFSFYLSQQLDSVAS